MTKPTEDEMIEMALAHGWEPHEEEAPGWEIPRYEWKEPTEGDVAFKTLFREYVADTNDAYETGIGQWDLTFEEWVYSQLQIGGL